MSRMAPRNRFLGVEETCDGAPGRGRLPVGGPGRGSMISRLAPTRTAAARCPVAVTGWPPSPAPTTLAAAPARNARRRRLRPARSGGPMAPPAAPPNELPEGGPSRQVPPGRDVNAGQPGCRPYLSTPELPPVYGQICVSGGGRTDSDTDSDVVSGTRRWCRHWPARWPSNSSDSDPATYERLGQRWPRAGCIRCSGARSARAARTRLTLLVTCFAAPAAQAGAAAVGSAPDVPRSATSAADGGPARFGLTVCSGQAHRAPGRASGRSRDGRRLDARRRATATVAATGWRRTWAGGGGGERG